jgi:hypothetical protein
LIELERGSEKEDLAMEHKKKNFGRFKCNISPSADPTPQKEGRASGQGSAGSGPQGPGNEAGLTGVLRDDPRRSSKRRTKPCEGLEPFQKEILLDSFQFELLG